MKPLNVRAILLCLFSFSILAIGLLINPSSAQIQSWEDKVDPNVLSAATMGQAEFLIYMDSQADLSGADALATKEDKGQFVYEQLTATAQSTQPAVLQTLSSLGAPYQSFWVTNAIWAKGNLAVIEAVAAHPEVAYVYASGGGQLRLPPADEPLTSTGTTSTTALSTADPNPEANLINVKATEVWSRGILGRGAVVAGADTGVAWQPQ
jgi:hypothetical protein